MDEDPALASIVHFIQDGAPPHYGLIVRQFLDACFGDWISRRGKIEWPARSCELTPCDFFLRGLLKDRVFSRNPLTLPDLKKIMEEEFDELRTQVEILRRTYRSVGSRCRSCIEKDGHQFEHIQ